MAVFNGSLCFTTLYYVMSFNECLIGKSFFICQYICQKLKNVMRIMWGIRMHENRETIDIMRMLQVMRFKVIIGTYGKETR